MVNVSCKIFYKDELDKIDCVFKPSMVLLISFPFVLSISEGEVFIS